MDQVQIVKKEKGEHMGMQTRTARRKRVAVATAIAALATAASATGLQTLPLGGQVNDDAAAGIDRTISVSGEEPSNADVVGGSLKGGKPAVPWAVFRQRESNTSERPPDQVFARSFAAGAWTTRGSGTVGGRSSSAPQFRGSLNFDQAQNGEAPSIDFAGAERTVPWASWYEQTSGTDFEANNIFASRFDNTGDANQGKWIFGGQSRGTVEGVRVPSLNIHTDEPAENPSVAGGSAVDPTKPGPWVTWQELSPTAAADQIFVTRPIGPGAANCDGIKPSGVSVEGHVPAIGGFCFQQTGIPRVADADPSLNVDTSRNAVEPDIAFTGASDAVPWVVWYEKGESDNELHKNEMVFAAKGVSDGEAADGGFHWVAVGSQLSGTLDTSGVNKLGKCAESETNEGQCSLNTNADANAENPRVAAGTMNPANPTSPWVTWDEEVKGVKRVFVSHLVGSGASAHFELANGGAPISAGTGDASRPDITFSGNTPYVSWREDVGGGTAEGFTGHFANPATFVQDQSDVPLTPTAQANVREPISSACIATPFNADGAACQGAAVGTPFFLSTDGTSPRGLFANAYQPDAPVTGAASAVGQSSATVSATINPRGAAVKVSFQYGTTTAYGHTTVAQSSGVSDAATSFSAVLTELPAGTTVHYRAVAVSDFGTFVGADETLTTSSPPATPPPPSPPPISVGQVGISAAHAFGPAASVRLSCTGRPGATCRVALKLTVTETLKGHRLVALTARRITRLTRKVVVVGTASVSLEAGETQAVRIVLNRIGKRLLASHRALRVRLRVTQATGAGGNTTVSTQTVTFKRTKKARTHRSN